jgi:ABC-2 type transport system permease protein
MTLNPGKTNAGRALLWMRTRFEVKQVVLSPAFPVLMVWGVWTTLFGLITQRDPYGRPTYPTTLSLIPDIYEDFRVIPLVIAIYYAGELVWRERDRRMHEIIDASPMPNWGYVVPKTLAMALVLMSALLMTVIGAVIVQFSLGYTNVEPTQYVLWYVLPRTWDMLLMAALAVFVQALSPHKAVGWGIMVLFLGWYEGLNTIERHLLDYASTPYVPLSDMNGAGSFWKGAWTFRMYWGAFAVLLLLVAHLLWRRGTEIRLKPRLARARRALAGAPGWVAAAALLLFLGTGAFAYYNTDVLNEYQSPKGGDEDAAEFERRFRRYENLPQPSIVHVTLDIALEPEERRAVTTGQYHLRNATEQPITDIHVRLAADDLRLTQASIAGARPIFDDAKYNYRIFRLDRAMQPGEERTMTFKTLRWHRGFRSRRPATRLVENGTFLTEDEFMPVFGVNPGRYLQDPVVRRKHGLQGEVRPPKLDDHSPTASAKPDLGEWTTSDITISTSADQTPIAPGRKISDVIRGGRRIARFVSEAPIASTFSIQSARYAVRHRQHGKVDLAVYYHPSHAWNVDRMLDAMAASLDYCQTSFGPYPFDHLRIVEFPGYGYYAQAFAGTVAYSEILDFVSDFRDPRTLDHVTMATAHEVAHQWWGHQVMPAAVEGRSLIPETLAQYTAMMVMKKLYPGRDIARILFEERDRYLRARASAIEEPPLLRVTGQNFVRHRKGAVVMYLLQERLGEDAVNRVLRKLVERYRFRGAPYPRSTDLVEALRAAAKTDEEQKLITDLFERITLYDLKLAGPTAVRRSDGRWEVTVPVEAKKHYGDGKGGATETPLNERIEIGLFTAHPRNSDFETSQTITIERHAIRSGRQEVKLLTDRKPAFAAIDPSNMYMNWTSGDTILPIAESSRSAPRSQPPARRSGE